MTTGRINQVTIFTGQASAPEGDGPGKPPERWSGLVKRSGPWPKPVPRPGEPPRPEPKGNPRAIQLPPLSYPRGGPYTVRGDSRRRTPAHFATYTPRKEDTSHPSRPETATSFGLPPSVLRILIAIGHPSTDSVGAYGVNPIGLRSTLVRARYSSWRANPPFETHTTVGWGDLPPRPKPSATSKAHAVFGNSAHGWRSCGHGT